MLLELKELTARAIESKITAAEDRFKREYEELCEQIREACRDAARAGFNRKVFAPRYWPNQRMLNLLAKEFADLKPIITDSITFCW